jgi:hypothetical protein
MIAPDCGILSVSKIFSFEGDEEQFLNFLLGVSFGLG